MQLRVSAFAMAAILASACSAAPGATVPTPTGIPPTVTPTVANSPEPTASVAPSSTPVAIATEPPTPVPAQGACPSMTAASAPSAWLWASIGRARSQLEITSVTVRQTGQSFAPEAPGPADRGSVIGGRELPMNFYVYYGFDASGAGLEETISVQRFAAFLRIDSQATRNLRVLKWPSAADPSVTLETLPDVDAEATIDFSIEWTDRCFASKASVAMPVSIASKATVGSCALDPDGGFAQLNALFDQPFRFGNVDARLSWAFIEGTYTNLQIPGDGPYDLAVFDASAAVATVDAGAAIDMRSTQAELLVYPSTQRPAITFHARGDVIPWLEAGGIHGDLPMPQVLHESDVAQQTDGTLRLHAPAAPGSYVAAVNLDYETPCGHGLAVAGVGVDVE